MSFSVIPNKNHKWNYLCVSSYFLSSVCEPVSLQRTYFYLFKFTQPMLSKKMYAVK